MKKISPIIAAAFSAAALNVMAQVPATAAKGNADAGRQKAVAICSGCHGVPGMRAAFPEVYQVPKISNQNEAYLLSALKAYKAGERYNQTMKAQASALTDKEMADLAAYYANAASTTVAAGK